MHRVIPLSDCRLHNSYLYDVFRAVDCENANATDHVKSFGLVCDHQHRQSYQSLRSIFYGTQPFVAPRPLHIILIKHQRYTIISLNIEYMQTAPLQVLTTSQAHKNTRNCQNMSTFFQSSAYRTSRTMHLEQYIKRIQKTMDIRTFCCHSSARFRKSFQYSTH